jgi:hypothetical protein
MAVSNVSPGYEHTVCTHLEGLEDEVGIDSARTHHPDNPQIGGVLKTADTCQVSRGIGTPIASKRNNFWIKIFSHK